MFSGAAADLQKSTSFCPLCLGYTQESRKPASRVKNTQDQLDLQKLCSSTSRKISCKKCDVTVLQEIPASSLKTQFSPVPRTRFLLIVPINPASKSSCLMPRGVIRGQQQQMADCFTNGQTNEEDEILFFRQRLKHVSAT
ncbi:hypothetical protein XENOCAPTIV_015358 [Xenoophorus captivus]|uniref:Uncharacterized protein n=1 Tax=Xenoophorus captivus TaxID=1517983 RepID=A0ABV0QA19_9TELE